MKVFPLFLTGLVFALSACSKEPGEGGKAEIRGVVYQQEYNKNTGQPVGVPVPVGDHRVFIIYGDGTYYDDDVRTGPDGQYRFPWLRKGTYKLYTFSECRPGTCDGNQFAMYQTVEIGGRKDAVDVPLITIEWWR